MKAKELKVNKSYGYVNAEFGTYFFNIYLIQGINEDKLEIKHYLYTINAQDLKLKKVIIKNKNLSFDIWDAKRYNTYSISKPITELAEFQKILIKSPFH